MIWIQTGISVHACGFTVACKYKVELELYMEKEKERCLKWGFKDKLTDILIIGVIFI